MSRTMIPRRNRRCLELILAGCALVALPAPAQEPETQAPAQPDPADVRKEAEQCVASRERIGERLAAIVADGEEPVAKRHEAARWLGKLQYPPAIDVLIQRIDLVDPTHIESEPRPDLAYPLMMTLAGYGKAAVPQIVDAYLAERSQERQALLAYAIRFSDGRRHGENIAAAQRYLRGTEPPDKENRLKTQNRAALEQKLKWLAEMIPAGDYGRK